MERVERIREWNGWLERYTHRSSACDCEMTFSIYLPPQAETGPVPTLYFLSGLTCTDDNVRTKAGAQRYAAEHGVALVMPDTSPRGDGVADEPERYDLGKGAGFYVNATEAPWAAHYHMFDYVTDELVRLVETHFPVQPGNKAVTGHSMGGHGALVCALRSPGAYKSASAFAPIANPVGCGWGEGCFGAYLGSDRASWEAYDATCLVQSGAEAPPLMVDQGMDDEFLADQLHPHHLVAACDAQGVSLTYREQPGYDHSYHFIGTFIGEHIAWHARHLNG
ncbi:MAG: S-formylglutathione hydrolase [Pseudomonadota bacterium]